MKTLAIITRKSDGKKCSQVRLPFIDDCKRNAVDWTGQKVVYWQRINPKTGKGWQAMKLDLASDFDGVVEG